MSLEAIILSIMMVSVAHMGLAGAEKGLQIPGPSEVKL